MGHLGSANKVNSPGAVLLLPARICSRWRCRSERLSPSESFHPSCAAAGNRLSRAPGPTARAPCARQRQLNHSIRRRAEGTSAKVVRWLMRMQLWPRRFPPLHGESHSAPVQFFVSRSIPHLNAVPIRTVLHAAQPREQPTSAWLNPFDVVEEDLKQGLNIGPFVAFRSVCPEQINNDVLFCQGH